MNGKKMNAPFASIHTIAEGRKLTLIGIKRKKKTSESLSIFREESNGYEWPFHSPRQSSNKATICTPLAAIFTGWMEVFLMVSDS